MPGDGEPTGPSEEELARTATAADTQREPAHAAPALGTSFGRYRVERELGAGGMGVVHSAFDPDLERRVALKVLHASNTPEARQRLLREARAMARLTHENVAVVHEVGTANGRDYVAMELIDGETLADWLKTPRTEREIIAAFVAAGRGLAAAHAAGLVHRDFKPRNVLRRKDGRIVVTDFGLARGVEVEAGSELALETTLQMSDARTEASSLSGLTVTGSVLGTPAYMAPEQWSAQTVGPAADQFAFCVALWEAFAGERPFQGTTLDALMENVKRGPGNVDDSKVPRRLRGPLRRGLDPDPKKRWPSMDALLGAIARANRRPRVALFVTSGVVLAAASVYVALGLGDQPTAVAACEPPVLDVAAVWPSAAVAELRQKLAPEVMALFESELGLWTSEREAACSRPSLDRARRLLCLDGVLARFDAVRKASVRGPRPSLDDIRRQLVSAQVCNVDDPPRLPVSLSTGVIAGLSLQYRPDPKIPFDVAEEKAALELAGDDPCARMFVRFARGSSGYATDAREAAMEAAQLAEACGDDRMRADAMLSTLLYQITGFSDAKAELKAVEAAVAKVAQPDLLADLDLLHAAIVVSHGALDEHIERLDSAIRGFGDHRPRARLSAAAMKIRARQRRLSPGDLEASRQEIARWREEAKRLEQPRTVTSLDFLDITAQWQLGDIEGADARLPEIYERIERERIGPRTGGRTITGTVVDAKGHPRAGALVVAGPLVAADSLTLNIAVGENVARSARTDSSGAFRLDNLGDGAIIVAQHGTQRSRVRSASDGARLVLAPTTRISGRVIAPSVHDLVVFAIPAERDESPMYQMLAPPAADGSFTIDRVPIGKLRIGAASGIGNFTQSLKLQDITVGPDGLDGIEVRPAAERELHVIVRSTVSVPLSGAQVFVAGGTISIRVMKDIEQVMQAPGLAFEFARPPRDETAPELGTLKRGDLIATFTHAPTGDATVCAIGLTGDLADPELIEKLQRHGNELEVRCVPVAADAKSVVVEVPPMRRFD